MPQKGTPKPKKQTPKKLSIPRKSKKNRGNNSLEDDAFDKTASHLKKEDYLVIIEWLNIKQNYNSCIGTGKAPAVGCPAKVHTKSIATGFGFTNEDQKVGISTIDEKLESMCPHYNTMSDLMGGQEFIPWFKSSDMECKNDFDEDVVIPGVIGKKVEKKWADDTNKSDEGKGNQEEFQPSGQLNKQGRPAINNKTTGIMLEKGKNSSSSEILPSGQLTPSEKVGHQTVRTSTPRVEPHQRKLKILSNHTRKMASALRYLNLSMELGEKKLDHRIKMEEKNLGLEKEEKEKYWSFDMTKLEQLASQEHIGKKYDLITQCVVSGKSTDQEIDQMANLFK
ncbi:hypothetical protein VP01_2082g4 [Puccinia sorghi]|uniref:No apical meristem-associated C-terminal domain-containing protein n=1 Tax=Puccinia sorghi TaxID=27349 RepID=A0A0L6VAH4_9BASI|nr:hypothetical protein VP01_2082g4 [Puccinia sorghi]